MCIICSTHGVKSCLYLPFMPTVIVFLFCKDATPLSSLIFRLCWALPAAWGLSPAVVSGLLTVMAPLVAEHGLQAQGLQQMQHTGSAASWHMESSQTRDQTHVSCIGRWTQPLNHQGSPLTVIFYNIIGMWLLSSSSHHTGVQLENLRHIMCTFIPSSLGHSFVSFL